MRCQEQRHPKYVLHHHNQPLWTPVASVEAREDNLCGGEDEEVTRLLLQRPKLFGESRSSCPNPVASELQVVCVLSDWLGFN